MPVEAKKIGIHQAIAACNSGCGPGEVVKGVAFVARFLFEFLLEKLLVLVHCPVDVGVDGFKLVLTVFGFCERLLAGGFAANHHDLAF